MSEKKRILIVDDDTEIRDLLEFDISSSGYFVENSRDDIMQAMEEAFSVSNVLIVSGVFGFGKRTAVRRYVGRNNYISAVEVQGMHDSLYNFFLNDLHFYYLYHTFQYQYWLSLFCLYPIL